MEQNMQAAPQMQAPPQTGGPGQNCIFCSIAEGKIQSKQIYSDEYVIGILDINPANPGHVLVIPKKHYSLMMQIPREEIGHIFKVCKKLSQVLLHAVEADGTNIFVANGALAGQKAPHFMVHIIPRVDNDNVGLVVPGGTANNNFSSDLYMKLLDGVKNRFGISAEQVSSFASVHSQIKEDPVPQSAQVAQEPQPVQVAQVPAAEPKVMPQESKPAAVNDVPASPVETAEPEHKFNLSSPVAPHSEELDSVASLLGSPEEKGQSDQKAEEKKKGSLLDSIGGLFK